MAIYQIETEIKERMRELKITTRELAYELKMAPGTLANQLGGWTPLPSENRIKIAHYLRQREEQFAIKTGIR